MSVYVSILNSICGLPRATTTYNIVPTEKKTRIKCIPTTTKETNIWSQVVQEIETVHNWHMPILLRCHSRPSRPAEPALLGMAMVPMLHVTDTSDNMKCGLSQLWCKMLLLPSQSSHLFLTVPHTHTTLTFGLNRDILDWG